MISMHSAPPCYVTENTIGRLRYFKADGRHVPLPHRPNPVHVLRTREVPFPAMATHYERDASGFVPLLRLPRSRSLPSQSPMEPTARPGAPVSSRSRSAGG